MKRLLALLPLCLLAACAPRPFALSPYHLHRASAPPPAAPPPPIARAVPYLPPPGGGPPPPTYTVVVNDVPVKELLFSIARDTKYNIDLYPGITGRVTLNTVNEPLPAILDRIAAQADLRIKVAGKNISILPDTPYVRTYTVNYVNMARSTTSQIGVAAQIAATGSGADVGSGGGGAAGGGNSSSTTVTSTTDDDFWSIVTKNIRDILAASRAARETIEQRNARAEAEKALQTQRVAQAEAVSKAGTGADKLFDTAFKNAPASLVGKDDVVVNPMAGTVTVLGTQREQRLVQQYLDQVSAAVQRQVLIEATIVEVSLKNQYRAGINWNSLVQGLNGWAVNTTANATTALANTLTPFATISYTNKNWNFQALLGLLESYGKTKVLSSPKLMALNNQTALLKVVDNLVYFTIQGSTTSTVNVGTTATFTTTPHTVPVGVVMSVTPQINENGVITLTVRPTITRAVDYVNDPNPTLAQDNIQSKIPVIQVREMESMLQVRSGQTVVLGGLIQDDASQARDGLPVLSRPSGIGALFGEHERADTQTELVIFLRPTVISEPSVESADLARFRRLLPAAATP